MSDSWRVRTSCPQCGGEVGLDVGDPILACSFCRTNLYLTANGPLRYRLPPAEDWDGGAPPVYLPFWRVRGLRYRVSAEQPCVHGALLDATVPGTTALPPEASLGIRPQVAALTLDTLGVTAVAPTRNASQAIADAESPSDLLHDVKPLFTRLVGEAVSLILAPYALERRDGEWYLREALKDGASHRVSPAAIDVVRGATAPETKVRPVRFIPLRCPECAQGLPASPGSVVLLCGHCARAWWVRGERLAPVPYAASSARRPGARYLPFWELTFRAPGFPAANRAEFRRWAISYQPVPDGWERQPCQMLVPAFKVEPRSFIRLARIFSLAPLDVPARQRLLGEPCASEPVRLPLGEAAQALRVVLADFLDRRASDLSALPALALRVKNARLLYLPFHGTGREWVEEETGTAIQTTALEHGARL